jgi:hypothetical protein
MSLQATEKRKETLASMCDERARIVQDQFNVSMNHIQAMSILISTFHHAKSPSAIDQVLIFIMCNFFFCSNPLIKDCSRQGSKAGTPDQFDSCRSGLMISLILQLCHTWLHSINLFSQTIARVDVSVSCTMSYWCYVLLLLKS